MPHRVLFVVNSLCESGPALQLNLLTRELANEYDIHIVSLQSGDCGFGELANSDAPPNRTFHSLTPSDSRTPNTVTSQIRMALRLRKLIGKLRPALVHTWCQPAERIALMACQRLRFAKPRIVSTELTTRPERRFEIQLLDRRLSRSAERMIVPHELVKQSLVDAGYREPRITVAPNAIEPSRPDVNAPSMIELRREGRAGLMRLANLSGEKRLGGAFAPLEPRTRLKDVIWATDLLTCIREDFHFFVFGGGTQLDRLKKFASQTEAEDHIHFVGLPENGLELVAGLDFFMHTHLNEPQPTMLLHAMRCGVPSISVYGPGTTEVIRHQETGFAVNFGARDEFARWTKYMLELPESAQQIADQGQAFVKSTFPIAKTADVYREVYGVGF